MSAAGARNVDTEYDVLKRDRRYWTAEVFKQLLFSLIEGFLDQYLVDPMKYKRLSFYIWRVTLVWSCGTGKTLLFEDYSEMLLHILQPV